MNLLPLGHEAIVPHIVPPSPYIICHATLKFFSSFLSIIRKLKPSRAESQSHLASTEIEKLALPATDKLFCLSTVRRVNAVAIRVSNPCRQVRPIRRRATELFTWNFEATLYLSPSHPWATDPCWCLNVSPTKEGELNRFNPVLSLHLKMTWRKKIIINDAATNNFE